MFSMSFSCSSLKRSSISSMMFCRWTRPFGRIFIRLTISNSQSSNCESLSLNKAELLPVLSLLKAFILDLTLGSRVSGRISRSSSFVRSFLVLFKIFIDEDCKKFCLLTLKQGQVSTTTEKQPFLG